MPLTVLPSKLQVPILPAKSLDRPRLLERLRHALRGPVTLIAADAGFGKSTLLTDFLVREERPAVWYRLDKGDGDPAVFAAHLLHGLRPHVPRSAYQFGRRGLSQASDWNAAAQLLSLTTHRLQRDVIVVLDDFHLLAAPGLSEGLTLWINALPPRAHLAILTRLQPELPLSRWRVQGRLAEFGVDDLRFTDAELHALLVGLHGLPLSDASLRVVAAKTEGWPAGIVLALHAALAQGPAKATQALGLLSGSSREIYDYLAQEAFARLIPEAQRFMLATATVTRFNLTLAQTLLGIPDRHSRQILDHLERSHLFVVPLDQERRWYRYHHLFQEFLQRIAIEHDPTWMREVHLRAAAWWERHGEAGEALHHLVEAEDFPRAAALLSRTGLDLVPRGHMETLRRWLNVIPREFWEPVPRLHLIRGLIEVVAGEARDAAHSLEQARRRLREAGDIDGELTALRWLVNAVIWEGGTDLQAFLVSAISEFAGRLEGFPVAARAVALELSARVALLRGDAAQAEHLFADAVAAGRKSGDVWTHLGCVRYQAALFTTVGRFHEAEVLYEEMLTLSRHKAWWHEHAHFHVELADTLLLVGGDDRAEQHLAEARLLQASIPCRLLQADLALTAARSAARRNAADLAEALLRELIGEGESATRYGRFRFDAWLLLAGLLAATDPAESRRFASLALSMAQRFDILRAGRAELVFGIVNRSAKHCVRAAEIFGSLGARHLKALALLHAAPGAPAETSADLRGAVDRALAALPEEGWDFLRAEASVELLAPYRRDPDVGPRMASFLRTVAPPSLPPITVHCLGQFELIRGDRRLGPETWPRAAPRRLLQFLLVQDRPIHREEATEALWPDLEPRHAANQLRVALSQLRRVLEPQLGPRAPSSLVRTSGQTIFLARERLDVDLDRFRRALARASSLDQAVRRSALAEAVGLFNGDLFADAPFEEWVAPFRDVLGRQYLDALTLLADEEESAAEYQAAIARWLVVIDRDPAAEHAYRGLMRSYLTLGRVADALRAFESCERALADLGAVPSAETVSLHGRIPRRPSEAGG